MNMDKKGWPIQLRMMLLTVNTVGFSQVGKEEYLLKNHFVNGKMQFVNLMPIFRQIKLIKGCRGNKLHMSAVVRAAEFIKPIEGDQQQICQVRDMKSQTQSKQNREVVKSIAKTVNFLAKENLPLRGHRDGSQYYHLEGGNPGNFQELLQF